MLPRANRVPEEYVAYERKSLRFMKVRDVPAGVPGAMKHRHRLLAKVDSIAILEPAIGSEGLRSQTETPGVFWKASNQMLFIAMGALDSGSRRGRKLRCAAGVIKMTVRHQNHLEDQLLPLQIVPDLFDIAAGIDDGGLARGLAPQNRAVLLKRRNG